MLRKFNPSQGTINLMVGIGLFIQFSSIVIMHGLWKHHRPYLYVLPLSLVGVLLSTVPPLHFKDPRPK